MFRVQVIHNKNLVRPAEARYVMNIRRPDGDCIRTDSDLHYSSGNCPW